MCAIGMMGCGTRDNSPAWEKWHTAQYNIHEKTIDGCEYIIVFGEYGRSIVHKHNCDSCSVRENNGE